jgi:hypothetical protein
VVKTWLFDICTTRTDVYSCEAMSILKGVELD